MTEVGNNVAPCAVRVSLKNSSFRCWKYLYILLSLAKNAQRMNESMYRLKFYLKITVHA